MTNDDLFAGIEDPEPAELLEIEEEEAFDPRGLRHVPTFESPADLGREVGRLGAPGPDDDVPRDVDDEADAFAWSGDPDDLSAEEAAVHVTYDPEFGASGDGYLS